MAVQVVEWTIFGWKTFVGNIAFFLVTLASLNDSFETSGHKLLMIRHQLATLCRAKRLAGQAEAYQQSIMSHILEY